MSISNSLRKNTKQRKIANLLGEHSGVSICILEVVNNRKWKSSWLLLKSEKHSMYRIRKVYWKSIKNPIVIKDEVRKG